jgi:hypothetical protein
MRHGTDMTTERPVVNTVTLRVWAGILALVWGYFFFGAIDLLVFFQTGPGFYAGTMLETGWGLVFFVLVAAPLGAVAVTPAVTVTALQQVYLVAVSLVATSAVSLSGGPVIVVAGLVGSAQLLAGCIGEPVVRLRRPAGWSWWPGAVVLAGTGPAMAYTFASASSARSSVHPSTTWGVNHWPVQAALPLAVLFAAVLAATYPQGWQVPAWCAAVSAGWFGVLAWTHPNVVATVSHPWAVAAIGWSVVFLLAIHLGAASRRSIVDAPS